MGKASVFSLLKQNASQLVAVIFCTLNALSDGMHFGWSAPTIPILQREDSAIKITTADVIKLEVFYMIFGVVGLPITVFLANRLGRKKSILIASTTSLVGWILIGIGDRVEYLIFARCLVGTASDVAFVCSPMYVAEVAHQSIRGFLASIIYVMVLTGVLIIYSIAPFVSIRIPAVVGACILLTQLIVFPFMPESPYYHLYKNNEIEARKSLKRLRGADHDIEEELKDIEAAIRRQKLERGRIQDLFVIDSNRKALIIMTILNCAQHMVGFTAILMNLHSILREAGETYLESDFAAIMFAGVMVIASMLAMLVIDKFGRKILFGVSSISCGICLLVIGIYYHLKLEEHNVQNFTLIPLIFIMIYAAFFKFGLGVIPIVMTAELFPARVRALGMTAADGIYVIFASLSLYLYQILKENYGLHSIFYLFALVSFISFLLNILFLPETKGKTLEEIQMILRK